MKHFNRIIVKNPVVDITGDEMAAVIWKFIKSYFIHPFLKLDLLEYDLSIQNRDKTNDQVTIDAASAVISCNVGIKCATITPNLTRMKEFSLKKLWKSPNATIRDILEGTILREPIIIKNLPKIINNWIEPIIIARHAFGDQYKAIDLRIQPSSKSSLLITSESDAALKKEYLIHNFDGEGVVMAMFNTADSIDNFAKNCFEYALNRTYPLFLSTKDTILKNYDGLFKDIFDQTYEKHYKKDFEAKNIFYEHRLIDDMVAHVLKLPGGFLWALKNYDGDVQSDFLAQGFGSLGLMSSIILAKDGKTLLSEAAHGTITRHWKQFQLGQETSTNSIASIFAWTRGLAHRAKLDSNNELMNWCQKLEMACKDTIEIDGKMTKDLAQRIHDSKTLSKNQYLDTEEFIVAISENLKKKLLL